jgi:hypothetical protein
MPMHHNRTILACIAISRKWPRPFGLIIMPCRLLEVAEEVRTSILDPILDRSRNQRILPLPIINLRRILRRRRNTLDRHKSPVLPKRLRLGERKTRAKSQAHQNPVPAIAKSPNASSCIANASLRSVFVRDAIARTVGILLMPVRFVTRPSRRLVPRIPMPSRPVLDSNRECSFRLRGLVTIWGVGASVPNVSKSIAR